MKLADDGIKPNLQEHESCMLIITSHLLELLELVNI